MNAGYEDFYPEDPDTVGTELDRATIAGWERQRFEAEASSELATLETVDRDEPLVIESTVESTVCLVSRNTAGLGVQLLWAPRSNSTHVTVTLNGETETFAVDPAGALDAYLHPFAYGATLPL